ncbi:MAG: hypothetical protein AAFU79_03355 [Myxococcota bacterium]
MSRPQRAHLIRKALDYVGDAYLYRLEGGEHDGEYVVVSSIASSLQFLRRPGVRAAMGDERHEQAMSNLSRLLKEDGANVRAVLERPEIAIFASDEEAWCGECLFEAKNTTDIQQVMRDFGYEVVHSTFEPPAASRTSKT